MKETEIKTFAEFHNLIETYDTQTVIYRGTKSVPAIQRIFDNHRIKSTLKTPGAGTRPVHDRYT